MAKRRKPKQSVTDVKSARAAARQADLDAGIVRRAWTAKNTKAVNRKSACRGRITSEG